MLNAESLVQALKDIRESRKGIRFINGPTESDFIPYGGIYEKALGILGIFQGRGIKQGEEMVFQIEDNKTFILMFWACLIGGIIPVPLTPGNNDEYRLKVMKIWKILKSPHLICSRMMLKNLGVFAESCGMRETAEEIINKTIMLEDAEKGGKKGNAAELKKRDTAFIQFSSGSTGDPKGVVLTHGNLLANIEGISRATRMTGEDSYLCWMPVTHDMGLIGCHLNPLVNGINQYFMPTSLFIRRPMLWLQKACEYKVTNLTSPNFGYKYLMDSFRPEKAQGLDLSSVRILFNGAEPISAEICDRFMREMSGYGLKKTAMYPVYGLAEASVAVAFPPPGEELVRVRLDRRALSVGDTVIETAGHNGQNAITFVDEGYPLHNCSVRICDDNCRPLGDNAVGHIHIKGGNVTEGYYRNEQATGSVMTPDGWLDTGDLGFLRSGRLTVTGRAKDIIFINGQNFYPHDIERIAEKVPGAEAGEAAACGIYNSGLKRDELVVFISSKLGIGEFAGLASRVKSRINKHAGITPEWVLPLRKLPKTTSGKLQRYKLARMYAEGLFDEARREIEQATSSLKGCVAVARGGTLESELCEIFSGVIEKIGIEDDFFDAGAGSLQLMKISGELDKRFPGKTAVSDLFKYTSIRKLAEFIESKKDNCADSNGAPEPAGAGACEENQAGIERKITIWTRTKEQDYYPLSAAQKRLYIIYEMQKDSLAYNLPYSVEIEGGVDPERLQETFRSLIRRHESFRTSFHVEGGEPVQRISKETDFKIEYYEAAGKGLDEIKKGFIRSFDLSKAPLLRAGLVRLERDRFVMLVDMHHIVSDGTSMGIFLRDFSALYGGRPLPEPVMHYRDYAARQHDPEIIERVEKRGKYWLRTFKGELPSMKLPPDYPAGENGSFECGRLSCEIPPQLAAGLKIMAEKAGVTMYMLLLAAYNVLLSKYTGEEDIIVGTPSAGRMDSGTENIIGMFVNTLAMRNYPAGEVSFEEFLKNVKGNTLDVFDNQEFQFDNLVGRLGIKRDVRDNPVFNTMFVMQNMDMPDIRINGLKFGMFIPENKTAMFEIVMEVFDGEAFRVGIQYAKKRFKEGTIARLYGHFIRILETVSVNPGIRLSEINILTGQETDMLLEVFNNTAAEYPKTKTAHELFEAQTERTPGKTALVFEGRSLSYDELNKKANQLAFFLRDKGVKPGTIVAVMAEQSLEMIAGILAVIKAGGAYLPIDPKYPEERIKYMIQDSGAVLLLTQEKFAASYGSTIEAVCLEKNGIYSGKSCNPVNLNTPGDLAYIIYTSGSTGEPKGVLIEHRALLNLVFWHINHYSVSAGDNATKYAGFGFDASVWEIFPYLLAGSTLHIISEGLKLDMEKLSRYFDDNSITICFLPTQICEHFMKVENNSLTRLLTGGDKLKSFCKKNYRVYNNYGPTENTVVSTSFLVGEQSVSIPIGKPVSNTVVYITDKHNKLLQPIGVPGELCISGDSLARGYHKRPELTANKFIENPFMPGKKIYKTGDLARWLPDGNIEFIGRIDCQVKIRGYRIELGEIENELIKHKGVKEAVVIDRDDHEGNKYLCAYLVADAGLQAGDYRRHLLRKLPEYMVPDVFMRLPCIPLNANGKIDRKALPEPDTDAFAGAEYEPPAGSTETAIMRIWAEALGLKKIGANDNFFDIGGNSLKAIRVVSKLSEDFTVTVNDIFGHQTIRELAAVLSRKKDGFREKIEKAKAIYGLNMADTAGDMALSDEYKKYEAYARKYLNVKMHKRRNYRNVLIAGATGYLGTYLMRELLLNSDSRIYAVVRSENAVTAGLRLKHKLDFIFKDESLYDDFRDRIFVFRGDISMKRLGLTAAEYRHLSMTADGIINAAANVKHFGRYEEFYGTNVTGTENLIRLAQEGKRKDLHHISTMSVGSGRINCRDSVIFSEKDCFVGQETDNYYITTKIEAEKAVILARDSGLNANIYRVGNLVCSSKNGVFQENIEENGFYKIIRAMIGMKSAPENAEWEMDFSFIDLISKAAGILINTGSLNNETFHLFNPNKLSMKRLIGLISGAGFKIEGMCFQDFLDFLYANRNNGSIRDFVDDFILHSHIFESMEGTRFQHVSLKTNLILLKLGFKWARVEQEHVARMLEYCSKIGFIDEKKKNATPYGKGQSLIKR